jgi:hypothetical protein
MMGSEGEAEQSEQRSAEAERRFPANSPRPSSPRGVNFRRSVDLGVLLYAVAAASISLRHRNSLHRSTCGAGQLQDIGPGRQSPSWPLVDEQPACPRPWSGPFLGAREKHLRGLVECRPHQRILQRFVGKPVPLLQEIDAQHPFQPRSAGGRAHPWDKAAAAARSAAPTEPPAPAVAHQAFVMFLRGTCR